MSSHEVSQDFTTFHSVTRLFAEYKLSRPLSHDRFLSKNLLFRVVPASLLSSGHGIYVPKYPPHVPRLKKVYWREPVASQIVALPHRLGQGIPDLNVPRNAQQRNLNIAHESGREVDLLPRD